MAILLALFSKSAAYSAELAVLLLLVSFALFASAFLQMDWVSSPDRSIHRIVRGACLVIPLAAAMSIYGYLIWPENPEIKLLCPRPLSYSLRRVEVPRSPTADNYATELTIRAVREPMYHARVFTRALFSGVHLIEAPAEGISTTETRDWEHYSFVVTSTHASTIYKVVVYTSEELRIVCVNQDN